MSELVEAHVEIEQLVSTYTLCVDSGAYARLGEVWAADAVMVVPSGDQFEGRDAIMARIGGLDVRHLIDEHARAAGRTPTSHARHHLTTRQIRLTGPDRAVGFLYYAVFTDAGYDHAGTYDDVYVKRDGRWWIARRQTRLEYVAPDSYYGFLRPWVTPAFTGLAVDMERC